MSNLSQTSRDVFIQNSSALNESQPSFRKDGLWFVEMGHWKGPQIIYSCVDLVDVFCSSCHTSISNVKGPHLGCVKMHHMVVTALTDCSCRGSKFSFSCKLLGITSWIWTKLGKVTHLGALHVQWAEVGGHVWWRTSESQESERER